MITVRKYVIYLIDESLAKQYIGKEKLFFSLFKEYHHAKGDKAQILGRQVLYITSKIPDRLLQENLQADSNKSIHYKDGVYYIHLKENNNGTLKGRAEMTIHQRTVQIVAEGSYDAETLFFEIIRKCKSSFLAVDIENVKYGWLRPIKERKLI